MRGKVGVTETANLQTNVVGFLVIECFLIQGGAFSLSLALCVRVCACGCVCLCMCVSVYASAVCYRKYRAQR